MRPCTLIICLLASLHLGAQQTISGSIQNEEGEAVAFANVFLEGSYDGCISDSAGSFRLQTPLDGEHLLRVSYIGYQTYSHLLFLHGRDTTLSVTLREKASELEEITITAGTFSASDRKKSATLTSFDIATTSSAMGDIYGAFATMPGSQKVGEDGMLFVRGGESYETRTYMDGMLVQSPYFAKLPDIPTRGRYSPLLFSETVFSTGGYSAEFGQALSSVVDLGTNGMETENKASISVMTVGAAASIGRRWEKSSLALSGLYTNSGLHNRIFKQNIDWITSPAMGDGTAMYRRQVGESGLLKAFFSYNVNGMEMNYDNFAQGSMDYLRMQNHNIYGNTSYSGQLNENWLIRAGLSLGKDLEKMVYRDDPIRTEKSAAHAKVVLTRKFSEKFKLRIGTEVLEESWSQEITLDTSILSLAENLQPVLFAESDWAMTKHIALRLGLRGEYSTLLERADLAPRLSAAIKTGSFSQVSLACGLFSQAPAFQTMVLAPGLDPERATHYMVNFQYRKNHRMFRIEAYLKRYRDLVKYQLPYSPARDNYSNKGSGHARGIDLFWRDKSTVRGLDYWISYSFLDTERDYRDFPSSAIPAYASAHNLSLVCKYFISPIRTFGGLTFSYASPRPYNDKNSDAFMEGRTPGYKDLSLGISHLTTLAGKQLVIHMNITNLLGTHNIFGYNYANTPDEKGHYASQAIIPSVGRQAVLVLLLSL